MQKKINKSLAGIILASGSGIRMNSSIPKQYLLINNMSLLEINIEKFYSLPYLSLLIVVINRKHLKLYKEIKNKYKNVFFIEGGNSRQKSAFYALNFLKKYSYKYVMIHDASRPFISKKLIDRLYSKLQKVKTAVIPVVKIQDSIKFCEKNKVKKYINRDNLFLTQTPQLFEYKALHKAYLHNEKKLHNFTDDAQVFAKSNLIIHTISGDIENIKLTTRKDWINKINTLKENFTTKIGHGFDTHKLIKGKNITLFGIKIPHKFKLLGHSDADVGVHAIIDALLGSCSLGDIGKHFPDTDKRNKGINSLIMLSKVQKLLIESRASISHIDCTLVGESPKISQYTNKMCTKLAKTLKTQKENISIKATTTEGLGFTGRKEGISCFCIATIKQEKKI